MSRGFGVMQRAILDAFTTVCASGGVSKLGQGDSYRDEDGIAYQPEQVCAFTMLSDQIARERGLWCDGTPHKRHLIYSGPSPYYQPHYPHEQGWGCSERAAFSRAIHRLIAHRQLVLVTRRFRDYHIAPDGSWGYIIRTDSPGRLRNYFVSKC